jgi:hypothetical protein
VKRNSGRKSTLTGRDRHISRRIVSKNHRTAAAQVTAELNIYLKTLFSQKLSSMSITKPSSMVGLQLLNLWLLKGARSSVVCWGTVVQPGRSLIRIPMRSLDFSIYLFLPATPWSWSQLRLWQKWVPGIFLTVNGSLLMHKAVNLSTVWMHIV